MYHLKEFLKNKQSPNSVEGRNNKDQSWTKYNIGQKTDKNDQWNQELIFEKINKI